MKHRAREVLRGRGERRGCNRTESAALVAVVTNYAITCLDTGQAVHLATRGEHVLAAPRQSAHGIGGKEVLDGSNLVVHVGNQAGIRGFDHASGCTRRGQGEEEGDVGVVVTTHLTPCISGRHSHQREQMGRSAGFEHSRTPTVDADGVGVRRDSPPQRDPRRILEERGLECALSAPKLVAT
eukprot:3940130-Rhodomonas_salina.1